jgi:hypothetical protein
MSKLSVKQISRDATSFIEKWRLEQANDDEHLDPALSNVATRLAGHCFKVFGNLIADLQSQDSIPKTAKTILQRNRDYFSLWLDSYGILNGRVDDLIENSRSLRHCLFRILLRINRILILG